MSEKIFLISLGVFALVIFLYDRSVNKVKSVGKKEPEEKKSEQQQQDDLINILIDMYSSNDMDLKKVKRELRKRFNIKVSLNKLEHMKNAQEEKRKEEKLKTKDRWLKWKN
tara:strand:- start:15242 stop:15574 length:333 start_codon:yes stop_codon:yes gene_type:complete